MSNREDEWREHQQLVALYQFYLDLLVKTVGAYFAIVGVIMSIVLANVDDEPIILVALGVPVLMSILLAAAARRAKPRVTELRDGLEQLGDSLHLRVKPHVQILYEAVSGLEVVLVIVSTVLAGLLAWLIITRVA